MFKEFKLALQPYDVQLTVHYNNYREFYGKGMFETHLNLLKNNSHLDYLYKQHCAMAGFIRFYSINKLESFLSDVINYSRTA